MLEKLKSFYHKSEYDYSADFIDPFEYHSIFYLILKIFKMTDIGNTKTPYVTQNLFIFIIGLMTIAFTIPSLYHGLHPFDIPHITEVGTYFIILLYELLILSCTRKNLGQYHNLLKTMKEDFSYICGPGKKYKTKFFENQLTTWKASIIVVVFTYGITFGMVSVALVSLIYFHVTYKTGDKWERPLLFPFWLQDVNFLESPIYELVFMLCNICIITYAHNYVFMIQTHIVWVRHLMSKADIVIWNIQDIVQDVHPTRNREEQRMFSTTIKNRMREIVTLHQSIYRMPLKAERKSNLGILGNLGIYSSTLWFVTLVMDIGLLKLALLIVYNCTDFSSLMDDYSAVYKKMLLYEQVCCGPVICLSTYCTAEKLENGELNLILVLICTATVVLCFIPSYLCTQLAIKVNSVADACWSISFWNAGVVIRPYLVLIMQRSLRSMPLKVPGFKETSLQTFSKKMASAYTCFNMLRQANQKLSSN